MKFEVMNNFTAKSLDGIKQLRKGQIIKLPEASARQLVEAGKIRPLPHIQNETTESEAEALSERMAITGKNCDPRQVKPFVTDFDVLVIPYNSPLKYHYWNNGQLISDTLKELGRGDLIPKYKSPYSVN